MTSTFIAKDVDRVAMEELVDRLRQAINISPVAPMAETRAQNLPGFTINVVFSDPQIAQQICAKITSMFLEENQAFSQTEVKENTDFLNKEVEEAKSKLDEQDAKLAEFQRKYLGSLPDEGQMNLNMLAGLTSQLEATYASAEPGPTGQELFPEVRPGTAVGRLASLTGGPESGNL